VLKSTGKRYLIWNKMHKKHGTLRETLDLKVQQQMIFYYFFYFLLIIF
jgi:hypothetical protein